MNYQDTSDSAYEFSAKNCIFQNAYYPGTDSDDDDTVPTGSPIFRFDSNADAYFEGCIIKNCENPGDGGAGVIYMPTSKDKETGATARKFVMTDTEIYGCKTTYSSGGIIRTNGTTLITMTLDGINMHDNYSGGWGNILWNANGTCNISNSTFTHNTSAYRGGAISVEGKGMTITGCTFVNNHAEDNGGAISMFPYTLEGKDDVTTETVITMNIEIGEGCKFEGNTATKGGAVAVILKKSESSLPTTLNASINLGSSGYMKNNTATVSGGAFYAGCDVSDVNAKSKLNLTVNSGSIYQNNAPMGGAISVDDIRLNNTGINTVTIAGGTFGGEGTPNTADYGGAIAIEDGNFIMSGGTISYNEATQNGGAVYVANGNYTMSNGTVQNNTASLHGGSVYISDGDFTMLNGTMTDNEAKNGGAAYIDGGNFTMEQGYINNNTALNGGALYIVGGNFLMTSGDMIYNSADNEGGTVYVNGRSIIVGIKDCTDENNKHESPKTHPNITKNVAVYGGGGFMTDGTLTMYCGLLRDNTSDNEGTGNNIYVKDGTFNLDGGTVGEETNPGIVLIGGQLNDTRDEENEGEKVTMVYHSGLASGATHEVLVTPGKYINLPAAQEGWTNNGKTMVGWTKIEGVVVRNFDDYKSVGMAIKVDGTDEDGKIHYYG